MREEEGDTGKLGERGRETEEELERGGGTERSRGKKKERLGRGKSHMAA